MVVPHLLYITAIITLTSCQKIPAHAITSIMQDILSPKNTEHLAQLIQGTASGRMQEFQMPNKRNIIQEASLPRHLTRNEVIQEVAIPRTSTVRKTTPAKVVMQRPNEVVLPNAKAIQKHDEFVMPISMVMQRSNDLPSSRHIIIKKPECATQNNVLVQKPEVSNRRILVQKANEIPMLRSMILPNGNAVASQVGVPQTVVVATNNVPQVARPIAEINTSSIVQQPRVVAYTAENVMTSNPYLPVASPGSSLTSAMTNGVPQSRGQFLRKIPIPPPTI